MSFPWRWILRLALLLTFTVVLTALQSSLWVLVFGSFPPPLFWLLILIYVAITRSIFSAALTYYLLTMAIASFTVLPFEQFLLINIIYLLIILVIKGRIYWPGTTYYMLLSGGLSLASPFIHWIVSQTLEKNPISIPDFFTWIVSALMTMLFGPAIFAILDFMDHIILQNNRSERIGTQYE